MAFDLRGFYLNKGEIILVSFEDRLHYAVVTDNTDNSGAVNAEVFGPAFAAPLLMTFKTPNTQCYLVFDHTDISIELLHRAMAIKDYSNIGDYDVEHRDCINIGGCETTSDRDCEETEPYEPDGG